MNPITLIDGYKLDHRRQYPPKTTRVYSNWTPRSSRVPGQKEVVFFGLQYFLEKYLGEVFESGFFNESEDYVVEKYANRVNAYLGPNKIGTDHVRALHRLGYMPLEFRALPEGTRTPLRVPMLTVENTHDDFAWLVNYIETLMSSVLWLPCTSATSALRMRKVLDEAAELTGSNKDFVNWQAHDFSFRGMGGPEAAALSGAGHLLFFDGTDTIPAIDLVEDYYGETVGGSVAATEHSVMCAGGKENETETFNRLLDLYPSGIVSVVSDTWDLGRVLSETLPSLKDKIMARDGKLVIRPDSGDPVEILCGKPITGREPRSIGVVEKLWNTFGGRYNRYGYRELDPHIGCIYGDSITVERAREICMRLGNLGFASSNVVLGVGSYTYQYVTRDTYGFAMKSTWVEIDGEGVSIFKAPKTDDGTKNSARGRLSVIKDDGELRLINDASTELEAASLLKTVWRNGSFVRRQKFSDIRKIARGNA